MTTPTSGHSPGPQHLSHEEYRAALARAERRRARARLRSVPQRAGRAVRSALEAMGVVRATPPDAPLPDVLDPRDGASNRLATAVRKQPNGDPSCVAYAVAGAMEAWWCRKHGVANAAPHLSVAEIFAKSGKAKLIEKAAKVVKAGVIDERCAPPTHLGPCSHAKTHSWIGRVDPMLEAPQKLRDPMRRELVNGNTLIITIPIFDNFSGFKGPDPYVPKGSEIGGHALAVVGYRRTGTTGFWIVRNSYGDQWGGDGGYAMIEWGHPALAPEFDVWVVRNVQNPAP